jgi:hypothetical protein
VSKFFWLCTDLGGMRVQRQEDVACGAETNKTGATKDSDFHSSRNSPSFYRASIHTCSMGVVPRCR